MWKIVKSKTFWFNLVSGVVLIVDALQGRVIPPEASATIVAVGNIVLRLITTKPIKEK